MSTGAVSQLEGGGEGITPFSQSELLKDSSAHCKGLRTKLVGTGTDYGG